jgi:hypothetical protein
VKRSQPNARAPLSEKAEIRRKSDILYENLDDKLSIEYTKQIMLDKMFTKLFKEDV